jgi:hypothetical protein
MDILTVLRYMHDHTDRVIGGLVALFLVTSILLLIRSIGERSGGHTGGSESNNDSLKLKDIESALKHVLSSHPLSVTMASAPSAHSGAESSNEAPPSYQPSPVSSSGEGMDPNEAARLQEEISTRDHKILSLQRELLDAAKNSSSKGQSSGSSAELDEKIAGLEARLAEYEIIEDDIADLSLYKEENARLKDEIEKVRQELLAAAAAAASAPAPTLSKVKLENEASLKFEKADRFELDINDDIMKEFAAAVEDKRAPTPDSTNKMADIDSLDFNSPDLIPVPDPTPAAVTPVAEVAKKALSADEEAQAKIDAMFAAASGEAPAEVESDVAPVVEPPPAKIAEPPAPAKKALSADEEAQAKIDAMFAAASGDAPAEPDNRMNEMAVDDLLAEFEEKPSKNNS